MEAGDRRRRQGREGGAVRRVGSAAGQFPQMSETVAAHVRSAIISGRLRPGDIVQPGPVGEELGVSATPAREALQALRVEGFLELVPRQGFKVAPLDGRDELVGAEMSRSCATCSVGQSSEWSGRS